MRSFFAYVLVMHARVISQNISNIAIFHRWNSKLEKVQNMSDAIIIYSFSCITSAMNLESVSQVSYVADACGRTERTTCRHASCMCVYYLKVNDWSLCTMYMLDVVLRCRNPEISSVQSTVCRHVD